MIPEPGTVWRKRYVTRRIVGIVPGGLVEVRDTWRDGFSRTALPRIGELLRWLRGAEPV